MSICVRLCVQYISCGYVSVQNLSETPRALSCGPPVADASCGSRALLRVCMKRKREGGVCRKVVSLRWSFLCFIYKHAVTHTKTLACVLTTVHSLDPSVSIPSTREVALVPRYYALFCQQHPSSDLASGSGLRLSSLSRRPRVSTDWSNRNLYRLQKATSQFRLVKPKLYRLQKATSQFRLVKQFVPPKFVLHIAGVKY